MSLIESEQIIDVTMRQCGVSDSSVDFERDLERLTQVLRLAEKIGDRRRQSQVLHWIGRTHYTTGHMILGAEPAERALAIADELGDEKLAALPVNLLGRLYFLSDFRKACPMLERSLRLIDPADRAQIALAKGGLGWSLGMVGEFEQGFHMADEGLALAQQIGHVPTEAGCYMYRGCAVAPRGDWPQAIADMRQALALAEKLGDQFRIYVTTGWLGGFLVMQEQHGPGMELLQSYLGMADRLGTKMGVEAVLTYIAESYLNRGLIAEALTHSRRAIAMSVEGRQRWTEAWARRVLGQALARNQPPGVDEAEREIREAVRIFEEIGTLPDLARALVAYGRLLAVRGEREGGQQAIGKAVPMLKTMRMDWDLARLATD